MFVHLRASAALFSLPVHALPVLPLSPFQGSGSLGVRCFTPCSCLLGGSGEQVSCDRARGEHVNRFLGVEQSQPSGHRALVLLPVNYSTGRSENASLSSKTLRLCTFKDPDCTWLSLPLHWEGRVPTGSSFPFGIYLVFPSSPITPLRTLLAGQVALCLPSSFQATPPSTTKGLFLRSHSAHYSLLRNLQGLPCDYQH